MATAGTGPAQFHVDSQNPTVGTGPDGKATQGVDITITTASGHKAAIFVPRSSFTLDKVSAILQEHANTVEAISRLGGGSGGG